MAVAYKSAQNMPEGATSTPACDKPADLADGDFVFVTLTHDTLGAVSSVSNGFSHWGTQASNSNDATLHTFYKHITSAAGEPDPITTITLGASEGGCIIGRVSYTGVDTVTPFEQATFGTSNGTATPASALITPSINDCMVVAVHASDPDGSPTGTASSSWNERLDAVVASTSYYFVEDILQTTAAAAQSQPTITDSDDYATFIVALRPPVVAALGTRRSLMGVGR